MLVLENLDQPKPYDAVRGGQLPPPVGGVVLGGLAGVKHRLSSSVSEHRIAALRETLNYGDAGLKIVIKICQSETGPVQRRPAICCEKDSLRSPAKNYRPL